MSSSISLCVQKVNINVSNLKKILKIFHREIKDISLPHNVFPFVYGYMYDEMERHDATRT